MGIRDIFAANLRHFRQSAGLSQEELAHQGIEQLPATLGEAIEVAADSELVLRTLGEHTFRRFVEIKRQEWDDYRVQVTPYEIENFLPIL